MKLQSLVRELQKDQDYKKLEQLEGELKVQLLNLINQGDFNSVIQITHALGLLLKYKPYGVKCCTLLGYAIFLLNEGEGFSFQQHVNFKTELFHFIEVTPSGYVFIAENEEVQKLGESGSLKDWWNKKHQLFDRFTQHPKTGEVYKIERVGIVHTAIGCTLEEYANTSTDMVERLFDQNQGRPVPFECRKTVLEHVKRLDIPLPKKQYALIDGQLISEISKRVHLTDKVTEYIMHDDTNFVASRMSLEKGFKYAFNSENSFVSFFCSQGELQLESATKTIDGIKLRRNDSVIIPPGTSWALHATKESHLSILKIRHNKAFL